MWRPPLFKSFVFSFLALAPVVVLAGTYGSGAYGGGSYGIGSGGGGVITPTVTGSSSGATSTATTAATTTPEATSTQPMPTAGGALSESQIISILTLLQAFGVDQSAIGSVNAALHGAPATSPSPTVDTYGFARDLQLGSTGPTCAHFKNISTRTVLY